MNSKFQATLADLRYHNLSSFIRFSRHSVFMLYFTVLWVPCKIKFFHPLKHTILHYTILNARFSRYVYHELLQVLRVMSCLLGLVVFSGGPARNWDHKTHLLVANHISTLDHMAVDLIEPCILPSVWDIPSILRW